jgi:pyruvate,water dikinase
VHHHAPPTLVGAAAAAGEASPPAPPRDDPAAYEALLATLSPACAEKLAELHRYNSVRQVLEAPVGAGGAGDVLRGVGISGPAFEGPALVGVMGVDVDPAQLADPALVFVTAATSTPFNLVIPMLGALVCDGGSLLGHPAITAREHGTPCVVGVIGCCATIATGDIVRVDADANTVHIVKRAPA